jgi:hypothetical protein
MTSTFAPSIFSVSEIVDEMLTTKKIPALSGDEMEALCSHLFALPDFNRRIDIAEIAYLNHDDPQALNIFLACTVRMAQRMAERKAHRVFAHPSDWQLEAMYDGAVTNLLEMFQAHRPLRTSIPNAFRRYVICTIRFGTMYAFRVHQANWHIEGVEDVTKFAGAKNQSLNPVERDVITRELLEQVTRFPHLREEHSRMLKTIAGLGPEKALRHDNCYWNGRHEPTSKQVRRRRAMLDLDTLATTMGVNKLKLQNLLKDTREILRDFFNRDGRLFAS